MSVGSTHLVTALATYLVVLVMRIAAELMGGSVGPVAGQLLTLIAFYTALGQSFNIFLGMTGYVNFGYAAFLALGMYGMASGIVYTGGQGLLGLVSGVLEAVALSLVLALVVGLVGLRLGGAYFAIATISVNEGLKYLIEGLDIWGGSKGLYVSGPLISLLGHRTFSLVATLVSDMAVFTIAVVSLVATYLILRSRVGYALRALREDEAAARVMGVNTTLYKLLAFSISGVLGGLLGAVWSLKLAAVYPPEAFNIGYTIKAIVIVMIGGVGTLLGPFVGGTLYAVLEYVFAGIAPGLQLVILAPVVIALIVAAPEGLVGMLRTRVPYLRRFIV